MKLLYYDEIYKLGLKAKHIKKIFFIKRKTLKSINFITEYL